MSFKLNIITPEALVYQGEADLVILPGIDGLFGVKTNHAPLIAALSNGQLVYEQGSEKKSIAIEGGFVEVKNNIVSVMTDKAVISA